MQGRFDVGVSQLLSTADTDMSPDPVNDPDQRSTANRDFNFSHSDDSDDPDFAPTASQLNRDSSSSSTQSETDTDDFDEFEVHRSDFQTVLEKRTPLRTSQSNEWALKCYTRWCDEEAKKKHGFVKIPRAFEDIPVSRLNYILSRFVMEAKDIHGRPYKSTTLYSIVVGLNRVLKDKCTQSGDDVEYDLLKTPRFKRFTQVLDGVLKERQQHEDPRTRKASTFSDGDYTKLWQVIGKENNAENLLTTLIYLATKIFSCRAGDELRRLTMKNFEIQRCTPPLPKNAVLIRYVLK